MRMGKLLAAAAVAALVAAPAMANPAASLSVVKASTKSKKSNKLAPAAGVAIGLVVVGATIAIVASDDDGDSD